MRAVDSRRKPRPRKSAWQIHHDRFLRGLMTGALGRDESFDLIGYLELSWHDPRLALSAEDDDAWSRSLRGSAGSISPAECTQGQPPAINRAAGRGGINTMWAVGLPAFAWSGMIRLARLDRRARNWSSSPAICLAD